MFSKVFAVFCFQTILIQYVSCQFLISSPNINTVVENTLAVGNGLGLAESNLATASTLGLAENLATANTLGLTGNLAGINLATGSTLGLAGNLANNLAAGFAAGNLAPSNLFAPSAVFSVTSYSPLVPNGLTLASENAIEGAVTVNGQLPFLSAVTFEGTLPSSGLGATSCGCGNGEIGITQEGLPSASGLGRAGYGNGFGFGAGLGRLNEFYV